MKVSDASDHMDGSREGPAACSFASARCGAPGVWSVSQPQVAREMRRVALVDVLAGLRHLASVPVLQTSDLVARGAAPERALAAASDLAQRRAAILEHVLAIACASEGVSPARLHPACTVLDEAGARLRAGARDLKAIHDDDDALGACSRALRSLEAAQQQLMEALHILARC